MQRVWRMAVVAPLLLCAALAGFASRASAADGLEVRSVTDYEVRPDGSIGVSVTAFITNRDPSTERRSTGRVFYYSAVALAVHEGASNVAARGPRGRLTTEAPSVSAGDAEPFRLFAVRFDRDLYFGESFQLTLSYDLTAVRAEQILVNRQYAFIPALGQGVQSYVRISAPAERQLTITAGNCARTADAPTSFVCGGAATAADYAAGGRCAFSLTAPRWECAANGRELVVVPFEVAAPDLQFASRSTRIPLANALVDLHIRHFAGDEAWAARVEDLVRRGLPLLEQANGFAPAGPPAIEVIESGYRDTHGYEGLVNSQGRIRLTPVVDDQTVLHETAHLWSDVFGSRWLAEGMADYTANVVARRLGLRPQPVREPLPASPILEEWGPLRDQFVVTRADRELEEAGYGRSLRFIELLAEQAGPATLIGANAALARARIRGTARSYLDIVEDISGRPLAPLFAQWALTPADVQALPSRTVARARLATLRGRAAAAGYGLPRDVEAAMRAWDFSLAERLIDAGERALDVHLATLADAQSGGYTLGGDFATAFSDSAESGASVADEQAAALRAVRALDARLDTPRSPLARVGLALADPSGDATAARAALADGDLEDARRRAEDGARALDGAERNGAIGSTAVAGVLVAAGFVMYVSHRRRRGGGVTYPPAPSLKGGGA